jgi:hypothetical protein
MDLSAASVAAIALIVTLIALAATRTRESQQPEPQRLSNRVQWFPINRARWFRTAGFAGESESVVLLSDQDRLSETVREPIARQPNAPTPSANNTGSRPISYL